MRTLYHSPAHSVIQGRRLDQKKRGGGGPIQSPRQTREKTFLPGFRKKKTRAGWVEGPGDGGHGRNFP